MVGARKVKKTNMNERIIHRNVSTQKSPEVTCKTATTKMKTVTTIAGPFDDSLFYI